MIRDLLATRVYRDSVRRAAELVGRDANGQPRKALLLDQTNLSSGSSLSPYDQETHYTSLWWASVVINASQDGLLSMLNWFQAADEPQYPKGMLRILGEDRFELKPVGLAQQFIARHWLHQVCNWTTMPLRWMCWRCCRRRATHVARSEQRDAPATRRSERRQCPLNHGALRYFGADNRSRDAPFACDNGRVRFELPGKPCLP